MTLIPRQSRLTSPHWRPRQRQADDGKVIVMHEYRRFIQGELDTRGWRQSTLVRKSGLSRQLVSSILRDDRDHLGQMPDAATMQALADGFNLPVATIRAAAARSLVNYADDGQALTIHLGDVSTDALLNEIRRRIDDNANATAPSAQTQQRTQGTENQEVRWEDDAPFRIVEMLSGPDKGQTFVVSASDFADGPPDQAKYRVLQVMDHLPRSTGKSKKQEADAEGSSQSSVDDLAKRRPPNPPDDAPPTDLADVDAARIEPGHVKQGDRVKHNDEVDQVDDEAGEESQDDDSGDL